MSLDPPSESESPYTLVNLASMFSICPGCQESMRLLVADWDHDPKFFVCFPCSRIFHIGHGEVTQEAPHGR